MLSRLFPPQPISISKTTNSEPKANLFFNIADPPQSAIQYKEVQLKVAEILKLVVRLFIVQTFPTNEGQFPHPPKVPLVAAVAVIGPVPTGKLIAHGVVLGQTVFEPGADTVTDPVPVPGNVIVSCAMPAAVPVKQTTLAVMEPVTSAPVDGRSPALKLLVTVAEIMVLPHASPTAVARPVELTITI